MQPILLVVVKCSVLMQSEFIASREVVHVHIGAYASQLPPEFLHPFAAKKNTIPNPLFLCYICLQQTLYDNVNSVGLGNFFCNQMQTHKIYCFNFEPLLLG